MTTPKAIARLMELTDALNEVAADISSDVDELETAAAPVSAKYYFQLSTAYKALDDARKRVYHVNDRLNKSIIPSALDTLGVDKIQVPDVARSFYVTTKYSASFIDKARGYDWLRERGAEDLIQETVNAGTLAAFCKSMVLDEGIDPPEDIVKFSSYQTTGMSKYTPKKTAV